MMRTTPRAAPALALSCLLVALAACQRDDFPEGPQPGQVVAVRVAPDTLRLQPGAAGTLAARFLDVTGAEVAVTAFAWSSADTAVATVDQTGRVTARAAGSARVSVRFGASSADAEVIVAAPAPAPVATLTVAPTTLALRVGDTAAVTALPRDAQGTPLTGRVVRFASSAPALARVARASGVVRAAAAGAATITATSEGRSAEAAVTVTAPAAAPAPVRTVTVAGALDTLEAFDVVRLRATLRDSAGAELADRAVRWTSSDPAVATVDAETGMLTGVDRGTVTVTATSEGRTGTASRVVVIRYRSVVAGTMHACDLASGGIAWCWGLAGREGRLGDGRGGDGMSSAAPVRVAGAVRFTQLAAFARHTCGLATDGRAWCWGYNGWGQLGDGAGADRPTPVAVGGGLTFRAIAVGAEHSCGVTAEGRAHCWGNGASGQLGGGTTASRAAPQEVAGGLTFAALSAGSFTTCAATTANAAYCWGNGTQGLLGNPASGALASSPQPVAGGIAFRAVSVGNVHACGIAADGRAHCWGSNAGRLGDGGGDDAATPRAVAGGLTWRALSAGYVHSCGVTTAGEAWCWGNGGDGRLGTGDASPRPQPARVQGLGRVQEVVAAGVGTGQGGHSCAIAEDRLTTWCWGLNDVGQLGVGAATPADTPNPTPRVVQGQRPLP
ncbi:Ig-like domain-containing protein [Roseisolibacter sp. H3M3-2]|uniref:RCC1 domain-containing protein n=1 Tax=Roseisolibacter sp. H3M3-2 TaxID=3031323 RepID=UPI0023DC108F|nr:Ig-like domain-containing protein [Roseisolibacter sp. H3M3-2]MDF1505844.1 Ig-like domain-containing protein [Roseisolibacter sp. H3M3-2]